MADRAAALVDHYHVTYDLTFKLWKERNRAFLLLITTLAIAALISYEPQRTVEPAWALPKTLLASSAPGQPARNSFLITALCYVVKENDCRLGKDGQPSETMRQFSEHFPHDAFDGLISIIILYLMLNITNLSSTIFRYYQYIGRLEGEVRRELDIPASYVAYAREGRWYNRTALPMQQAIRYFYVAILTSMLVFYFSVRIASEMHEAGSVLRLLSHAGIGLLACLALYGYMKIILGRIILTDQPTA